MLWRTGSALRVTCATALLIALELQNEVEAHGQKVVGISSDMQQSIALVLENRPDLAFADIQLRDGPTGVEIGRFLTSKAVPFVFVSANLKRIPRDFAGAMGAIEKPYTANGIQKALAYLEAALAGLPQSPPPSNLVLARTLPKGEPPES